MIDAVLICPKCKHKEIADKNKLGMKLLCPKCGQTAIVVDPERLKKLNIDISSLENEQQGLGDRVASFIKNSGIADNIKNSNIQNITKEKISNLYDTVKEDPLFVVSFFDRILNFLKNNISYKEFVADSKNVIRYSQYIVFIVALVILASGIIFTFRGYKSEIIFYSIGIFICLFLTQYISIKSLDMIKSVQRGSTCGFSSQAFFDINAFVILCLMVYILLFSIYSMIKSGGIHVFIIDSDSIFESIILLISVLSCLYVLFILFLHPRELLNIEIEKNVTAGEEFLSLSAIMIKIFLLAIPYIYCAGCFNIGFDIIYGLGSSIFDRNVNLVFSEQVGNITSFFVNMFLPFILYMFSIWLYFMLDCGLAIFKISRRADRL